jgi:hypothetical protein
MFFMTRDQAARWAEALQLNAELLSVECVDSELPGTIRIKFDDNVSSYALARRIVKALGDPPEMCLWITEYGIWPSVENLHLYYRVRNSYGDSRPLSEAPAHRFLGYEHPDLVTFIQLMLESRWGGHLFSAPSWVVAHISHDGWAVIEAGHRREEIAALFTELDMTVEMREAQAGEGRRQ